MAVLRILPALQTRRLRLLFALELTVAGRVSRLTNALSRNLLRQPKHKRKQTTFAQINLIYRSVCSFVGATKLNWPNGSRIQNSCHRICDWKNSLWLGRSERMCFGCIYWQSLERKLELRLRTFASGSACSLAILRQPADDDNNNNNDKSIGEG